MRRSTFLLSLVMLAVTGGPISARQGPATTIVFVRHAEAAGGTDPRDPTLSPAGQERAKALVKALSSSGVAAVYTSQYNRTRMTGEAVAAAASVTATAVPVVRASLVADAEALIARIVKEHAGKTVLVVGHSNTVPLMVQEATGVAVDPIAETEFDRMYVVTIRDGVARVISAKY